MPAPSPLVSCLVLQALSHQERGILQVPGVIQINSGTDAHLIFMLFTPFDAWYFLRLGESNF